MIFENIRFEVQGSVARLTLNRPDKMNSFNSAMHAELRVALDQVQEDKTIRVLVLTGAGRGFCAGRICPIARCSLCLAKQHPIWATWLNKTTSR